MNIKHTILLLLTAALTACSDGDDIEGKQPTPTGTDDMIGDRVPVAFTVSDQRNIDFTRATTSIITFNANEDVKVFVKPYGATNYTSYDYKTASSGQSVGLTMPATPPYFPPGTSTTVEAYAYYPSTAGASATFTVQDDQTSDANYKASDLMYANNRTITKGAANGNNNLQMAHQMAQLKITANGQIGSGINVTRVEVIAQKSVTFAPNNANIVTTTGATGTILALSGPGTGYIVIPPQVINGVTIKVYTGSETKDEIATYAFTGTGNFNSGDSYAIDLTISADQLGFTTAINNWNGVGSVNVIPSGSLTISAIPAQEYTGNAIKPSFTVKKGEETVDPSLYDTIWVSNVDAGKAYIIVTGKGSQEGAVGMTSFTITPANGKITYDVISIIKNYGSTPFTNPLRNYDKRTEPEYSGKLGDGPVTYESSDPTVATVDENGEVTLVKAGTTKIRATATNGANYVYSTSLGDNTTYYDLTVNKAAATISFPYSGSANPSQTWSATAANNKYTQTVTNSGDGAVSYSIGSTNTCGASINNSSTGEVTFTKSGSVEVIATVVASTDRYTYAVTTASYTLTVNKATGFVTLNPTSGSVDAGNSTSFTVASSHGGALSVTDVSGNNRTTSTISGTTVNVATNGITPSSGTIRVTSAATDCYNEAYADFDLTINSAIEIKMNPLWYVAEYNMTNSHTSSTLTMGSTMTQAYYYTWAHAMARFSNNSNSKIAYYWGNKTISGQTGTWHLPTVYEMNSIIPSCIDPTIAHNNATGATYISLHEIAGSDGGGASFNYSVKLSFGYNDVTKGTNSTYMTESSFWYRKTSRELYAVRYCGTNFCSIWKYERTGSSSSNTLVLTITSKLIGTALTTDEASDTYGTDESKWTAEFENLEFTDANHNIDLTNGAVRRSFYGGGDAGESGQSAASNSDKGKGWYWTATEGRNKDNTASSNANHLYFYEEGVIATAHGSGKSWGFPVRLFRDN